MKFTLLSFLFFSSISALGAPMGYRRHSKPTTAIAPSAASDEIVTEVVTITITAAPTASSSLPSSTPPPYSTSTLTDEPSTISTSTLTDEPSTTSSQAPQETAPSQALLNAQEAQRLNTSFRDLKLTDACPTGASACVEGVLAECIEERWTGPVGTPCSESEQCFAVPVDSLTDAGTKLVCMSEQGAAFFIKGAGADGGVFGGQ